MSMKCDEVEKATAQLFHIVYKPKCYNTDLLILHRGLNTGQFFQIKFNI
jgi:hypothetical protein